MIVMEYRCKMMIIVVTIKNSQLFSVGEGNDMFESTSLLAKSSNNSFVLSIFFKFWFINKLWFDHPS